MAFVVKLLLAVASNPLVLNKILDIWLNWNRKIEASPELKAAVKEVKTAFLTMQTEEDVNNVARKIHELQKK